MPSFPTQGGNRGTWGTDLNAFLSVAHDAGGKVHSGGAATLVVAASDAPTAVQNRADYVCDGTADQVEINSALAAGLRVALSQGTFNIAAPILIQNDNQVMVGQGIGQANAGVAGGNTATTKLVAVTGLTTQMILVQGAANTRPVNGAVLRDFVCDGANLAGPIDGVVFRCHHGEMVNVECDRFTGNGITVQGYAAWSTYNSRIARCLALSNALAGLLLSTKADDLHVTGFIGAVNQDGIYCGGSSAQLSDCHVYSNTRYGIALDTATRTKMVNCKVEQNATGGVVWVAGDISGIQIVGCGFKNNDTAGSTYDDINLIPDAVVTGIVVTGCNFINTGSPKTRYGVNFGANVRKSTFNTSNWSGSNFATASYLDSGTDNLIIAHTNAATIVNVSPPSAGINIATTTAQKVGFYGVAPIAQRAGAAQAAVATTSATQTTPWGFSTQAQADAIVTLANELRAAGVALGLIKGSA
jgi:hypothetical protein